jgi:chromosome transmission fidelity protein 18
MGSISSPVIYPSSSPPPIQLSDANIQRPSKSRSKTYGGFLVDEEDEIENVPLAEEMSNRLDNDSLGLKLVDQDHTALTTILQSAKPTIGKGGFSTAGYVSIPEDPSKDEPLQPFPYSSILDSPRSLKAIKTCSGKTFTCITRKKAETASYESIIAARSATASGRAKASYYGVDIHKLLEEHTNEKSVACPKEATTAPVQPDPSIEQPVTSNSKVKPTMMWTEKYRARKFTDLVGDERTHRQVLRWVKGWDPIVFPGSKKSKPAKSKGSDAFEAERPHRKILLLTGPPGLGKTTLAHVCARQAGYEVQEINASDERSSNVVKGRIRDSVGTENVRGVHVKTGECQVRKAGRPVCVIVDEVDGVVGGSSGSGEGGFVKALIDLIILDQKNSALPSTSNSLATSRHKKKGDGFRLLRPLILICNDVYHPALRPLRQSSMAEVIHIRKPPISTVATRLSHIFQKEGYSYEVDGVRRLCEAAWGISNRREQTGNSGGGEGDLRGILVVAEWVASKLRAGATRTMQFADRLTRKWVEDHILGDHTGDGGAARGLGRGGIREIVDRVFKEGAGFPKSTATNPSHELKLDSAKPVGVAEAGKRRAIAKLREMVDMCGDSDRIIAGKH